jgi:methylated-DNA-[protein]-cysteine S-methyltransferase
MTGMNTQHAVLATRLGHLTIVRDGDLLTGLYFPRHWYLPDPASFGRRSDSGFEDVAAQLDEYLAGGRTSFDLPLDPRGSELQLRVWELIAQIPYGQTTTYGDLARRLGGEATPQEVGAAAGRNPLSVLVPCHRVIASTGKLTGYAGGLRRKRELLELERAAAGDQLPVRPAAGSGTSSSGACASTRTAAARPPRSARR